jgi:L-aspartate oxidase
MMAAWSSPQAVRLPVGMTPELIRTWGELRNLYDIAWLILKSAAFRTESRGGHFREDYPATDPLWQVHTVIEQESWRKSSPVD